MIDFLYEELSQLDNLSQPGVRANISRDDLVTNLETVDEMMEDTLDTVKTLRNENFIYRHIGEEGVSLRAKHIDLSEVENGTKE